MKTPLEGIKVLDLSHALAGPHCSTLLADFGAEVYKLETPGFGDIARAWGAPLPGDESSYFTSLHRNKRGLSIDLKSEEGKALFFELAGKVDVILENFRVGALKKLGLGYEEVRKRNPGIVYCSISGFGQDGPYTHRAAMDLIVQAESGMISITGEEGGRGVRCGVSIADLTAGMYAALGIVMALRVKEKTGVGQHVDISMLEGQLSLLKADEAVLSQPGHIGPIVQRHQFALAIEPVKQEQFGAFAALPMRPAKPNTAAMDTLFESLAAGIDPIDAILELEGIE